jgi:predicted GH43/DUF377 family glycosyl hydrolase
MVVRRFKENPLITTEDVKPLLEDSYTFGAFNCAATRLGDEVILLLRVCEKPYPEPGKLSTFIAEERNGKFEVIKHTVPADDPRGLNYHGAWCPDYTSYMRLARSKDGINFEIDDTISVPFMSDYDEFGMEDPRITKLGDTYYINYSAISRKGINTVLLSTKNFKTYENHGIIFYTDDKDVCIFPEKSGGKYYALHRPARTLIGPSIWIASSPDLIHWGGHEHLIGPTPGSWDEGRVGANSHPIKTEKGWLCLCHAAHKTANPKSPSAYVLSLMLLDLEDPTKVLAYSKEPFMRAATPYEFVGYLPNVIFQCGHLEEPDGRIVLYYGAADDKVCAAETTVDELLGFLLA